MMVMCRACGHFVSAVTRDGDLEPVQNECPECGNTEFVATSDRENGE